MTLKGYKLVLFFWLMLFMANFVCAQNEAEIKSNVEKFYKFHRTRSGIISTHELNLRKTWFTPELVRLFRYEIKREDAFVRKNPDEKPYFGDGFPFQPFEECVVDEKIILNRLETGKVKVEANKATVEVSFYIPKECESQVKNKLLDSFKIELLKIKSRWLISDWIYANGERLTQILKREKY